MKFIDPDGHGEKLSLLKTEGRRTKYPTDEQSLYTILFIVVFVVGCIFTGGAFGVLGLLITSLMGINTAVLFSEMDNYEEWMENVDDDEALEEVRVQKNPDGTVRIYIIDDDGTIYQTLLDSDGNVVREEKTDHDGRHYVKDPETGEWLPDGNQDGIPDDRQQSNRDDIQSSGPGDSGNPEGGGGAAGGDCQIL